MNILFIGDIVGKPGRRIVKDLIASLKQQYQIEIVIVNGENSAHGKGITPKIYQEFITNQIDCVTLGNHAFAKQMICEHIDCCDRLIRPQNMLPQNIGKSSILLNTTQGMLAIHNLCGEVFMNNVVESPYQCFAKMLEKVSADMHFVDFHAEATAEKLTFLHMFKSRCVGIVGTHTHVMTADEQVLEGCGYITDVGMCGARESILGRDIDEVLQNVAGVKTRYEVALGSAMLNAVLLTIENRRCVRIKRIVKFENDY